MIELFSNPTVLASLAALTVMEIVLGVDNIVFISILASRLPAASQARGRLLGLAMAGIIRIGLIFMIGWIIALKERLFTVFDHDVTGRDLIMFSGGLFLIYKATKEIHHKLEGPDESEADGKTHMGFTQVVIQIALLNIVFSLDSIVTAVGMTDHLEVMIVAVVVSLAFMVWVGGPVGKFVVRHPSVKMLALSFLLLIGFSLAAEGLHTVIPKPYIYSAMAFSMFVEMLNVVARRRNERRKHLLKPVQLRQNVVGMTIEKR